MAKDSSFDVVSEVNFQEMDNAVNQAMKEIEQRYDFKGSKAQITLEKDSVKLNAEDDYKIKALLDILIGKMIKRGISPKALNPGKIENAFNGTLKQNVEIQNGLSKEKAKEITAYIKELKLKVQAQIMDDKVRVSGAKKDDLQLAIQSLKSKDFGIDLQFANLR
ncbi:YajQ family cyclic di-GMP-binding protein [Clostridiaceae bacterium UIB06]|uniref:Nucleotide-binding protein I6U48_05545 n=1 Tax=Clostridium thailandense TaxID=2794346 RepID=A0A949TGI1_9CLOT|nr:YajQ family cyclic di-GMP-binding protein [Clostridium thailandense]MBV7272379.1 YajQ family cyclic di-GMP-binding protein [Clostridium thailandense]MCH5135908.1 YajQ family cyclic di-GMP-binding protein [Clostridiaceae bacterium UIB06]